MGRRDKAAIGIAAVVSTAIGALIFFSSAPSADTSSVMPAADPTPRREVLHREDMTLGELYAESGIALDKPGPGWEEATRRPEQEEEDLAPHAHHTGSSGLRLHLEVNLPGPADDFVPITRQFQHKSTVKVTLVGEPDELAHPIFLWCDRIDFAPEDNKVTLGKVDGKWKDSVTVQLKGTGVVGKTKICAASDDSVKSGETEVCVYRADFVYRNTIVRRVKFDEGEKMTLSVRVHGGGSANPVDLRLVRAAGQARASGTVPGTVTITGGAGVFSVVGPADVTAATLGVVDEGKHRLYINPGAGVHRYSE